jgi:hypothetical protein
MLSNTIKITQKSLIFISILFIVFLGVFINTTKISLAQNAVVTTYANNIGTSNATLNGLININNYYGPYNYFAYFEYWTNTNTQYTTPTQHMTQVALAQNNTYSYNLTGLKSNTVYYFRAVAQTPSGVFYGNVTSFGTNATYSDTNYLNKDQTTINTQFNTITKPATSISSNSVKLNSITLNPNSDYIKTYFEYGKTEDLGNSTATVSAGTLSSIEHINTLTRLSPNTTYYFRAVAESPTSIKMGAILNFTTNSNSTVSNNNTNTLQDSDVIIPVNQNTGSYLGANAFGSGVSILGNILTWMLIIIVILILVFIFRGNSAPKHSAHSDPHGH